MKNTVIIPTLEPTDSLVSYIDQLLSEFTGDVIVVNDGSSKETAHIFDEIKLKERCTVLTHEVNRGKGAALKTAISYLKEYRKEVEGIITADSDGQHSVKDVIRMNQALIENKQTLVLGVRDFGADTPVKSKVGNVVAAKLLSVFYGISLSDTQTGLRAISSTYFDWLLQLPGERYEYELNMLIYTKKANISIHTITIQCLYFDNNSGSHFKPISDSIKVTKQMLNGPGCYLRSSVLSAVLDVSVFTFFLYLLTPLIGSVGALTIAAVIARILSSICNLKLNHKIFNDSKIKGVTRRYYTLWLFQLSASIVLVNMLTIIFPLNEVLLKLMIDLGLALFSYQIQLHWVFKKQDESEQGLLFKMVRKIGRLVYKKSFDESLVYEKNGVLIGHHQNLYGPIIAALYLPKDCRLWVLDSFFDQEACFKQYYEFTFTERLNMPKVFAYVLAKIASEFVPRFLKSAKAIPVHRQSLQMKETFSKSIELLEQGYSIVIFPDEDYASNDDEMGEIYTGFLNVLSNYYKRHQVNLPVIPFNCHKGTMNITVANEIYVNQQAFSRLEKERVCHEIIMSMNQLSAKKKELVDEFLVEIQDMLEHPLVKEMIDVEHHCKEVSRLEHSLYVAYVSYIICQRFGLDAKAAARASLVHDFALQGEDQPKVNPITDFFIHPRRAAVQATPLFDLSQHEQQIIESHMWPATPQAIPLSKEAFVVNLVDTYCAVIELLGSYKSSKQVKELSNCSALTN